MKYGVFITGGLLLAAAAIFSTLAHDAAETRKHTDRLVVEAIKADEPLRQKILAEYRHKVKDPPTR